MAVTRDDLLHIANLARVGVDDARVDELTRELSSILGHMEVLAQVDTSTVALAAGVGSGGTPLRPDDRVAPMMEGALESFAPSMRDGFFIVPRLATHEDPAESGA
ncbi:MAG TPA: Asp-tRNA(Asn)/Glu-tRNA(Gln) amidotransferase subunit GatC [Gemmatimonadaceae bacterium]|nr:Asp-tRNA(Asn)/Glu-tRNA(Gln) amidotransferase subunit GatC [Gemmatimonadaceae bacterium]